MRRGEVSLPPRRLAKIDRPLIGKTLGCGEVLERGHPRGVVFAGGRLAIQRQQRLRQTFGPLTPRESTGGVQMNR